MKKKITEYSKLLPTAPSTEYNYFAEIEEAKYKNKFDDFFTYLLDINDNATLINYYINHTVEHVKNHLKSFETYHTRDDILRLAELEPEPEYEQLIDSKNNLIDNNGKIKSDDIKNFYIKELTENKKLIDPQKVLNNMLFCPKCCIYNSGFLTQSSSEGKYTDLTKDDVRFLYISDRFPKLSIGVISELNNLECLSLNEQKINAIIGTNPIYTAKEIFEYIKDIDKNFYMPLGAKQVEMCSIQGGNISGVVLGGGILAGLLLYLKNNLLLVLIIVILLLFIYFIYVHRNRPNLHRPQLLRCGQGHGVQPFYLA